jgi:hypothetical protein
MFAAEAGWTLRIWQIAGEVDPTADRLPHMLTFAVVVQLTMVGVGVYGSDSLHSLRVSVPRLFVAISLAVLGLALVFFLVPAITFWRSNLLYAMLLALAGLGVLRVTFGKRSRGDVQAPCARAGRRPPRRPARPDGGAAGLRLPDRRLCRMNDGAGRG